MRFFWNASLRFLMIGIVLGSNLLPAQAAHSPAKSPTAPREGNWTFQKDEVKTLPGFGTKLAGAWGVAAEPDHPANKVLAQMDYGRKMAVYLSKAPYVNFSLSLRLRTDMFEQQTHNWQVGIFFRHQDARHFYKLRVTAANVALIAITPAVSKPAAHAEGRTATAAAGPGGKNPSEQLLFFLPLGVAKDQWQRLGVKTRGEFITVSLNGRDIQTLADGNVGSGQFGLYTYNTRAYFDDIVLQAAPTPALTQGLAAEPDPFYIQQAQDVMVYYYLPQDGSATVQVLDPKGQIYNVLTKGPHSRGLNAVTWDGQGLTTLRPAPGMFTLELKAAGLTKTRKLQVKTDLPGKGSKP